MVDIAVLSSPTPTSAPSGGNTSGAGASSAVGSAAAAPDAVRDDCGGAHPFAELMASLAKPGPTGEVSASPTLDDPSVDAREAGLTADDQPSDATYALVGAAMAAMPITPLIDVKPNAVVLPASGAPSTGAITASTGADAGTTSTTSTTGAIDPVGSTTPAVMPTRADLSLDAATTGVGMPDTTGALGPTTDEATGRVAESAVTESAVTDATAVEAAAGTTSAASAAAAAPSNAADVSATRRARPLATDTKVANKQRVRSASAEKANSDESVSDAGARVDSLDDAGTNVGASALHRPGDRGTGGDAGSQQQRVVSSGSTAIAPRSGSIAPSSATSAVASPSSTSATSVAQPWEQVLSVLRPTKRFSDGSHRLSIQMTPEDLGKVTIELSMHRGELSLHMLAEHEGTADVLRSSLHELRNDLEGSGQRTGSFEVAEQWAQQRQNQSDFAKAARFGGIDVSGPGTTASTTVASIDLTAVTTTISGDGRIDVRI